MNETVNAEEQAAEQVEAPETKHIYLELEGNMNAKPTALCDSLEMRGLPKTLIFCNSPSDTDLVEAVLKKRGITSEKLIGHVPPRSVHSAVQSVLSGQCHCLIATDIPAPSIDIGEFELVINYSIHNDPEIYLHRLPEQGQNKRVAECLSLVGPSDLTSFQYLKKILGITFAAGALPTDAERAKARLTTLVAEAQKAEFNRETYAELWSALAELPESNEVFQFLLYNTLERIPELEQRGGGKRRGRGGRQERSQDDDGRRNSRSNRNEDDESRDDRQRRRRPTKKDVRFYVGKGEDANFTEDAALAWLKEAGLPEEIKPERMTIRKHYTFIDFDGGHEEQINEVLGGDDAEVYACRATLINVPLEEDESASEGADDLGARQETSEVAAESASA